MTSTPVIVFVGTSLSMLIGIVFQSLLASRLGTGSKADTFYLGATVPTLFATVLLGSTPNALIRVATERPSLLTFRRGKIGPRLLLFAGLLGITMVAVAGALLADAPVLAHDVRHGVGEFLLVTAVVPILALLAAVGAVLALARQHFVIATYGGVANGVGLVTAATLLAPFGLTPITLGFAVDCGYMVQVLLVCAALRRARREAESPLTLAPGVVAGFLVLAASSAVYKSQPLVERAVGSTLSAGLPAALGYADKITVGLMQLAVFGFALAALPSLSRALAAGDELRAASRVRSSLAATAVSAAAVIAFGAASSGDLVRLLYERGAFDEHSAYVTHQLVLFALPSIALGALAAPIVAAGYAAGHVRQIALIGIAGFAVGTVATAVLGAAVGFRGIVLGTAIGYGVTLLIFAGRTSSILPGWTWLKFGRRFGAPVAVAVAVAATVAAAVRVALPSDSGGVVGGLFVLGLRLALVLGAAFAAFLLWQAHHNRRADRRGMAGRVLWLTLGGRDLASSRVRAYFLSDALERSGFESQCVVGRGIGGRLRALTRLALKRADVVVIQKLLYGRAMLRLLRARTQVLVWECDDALHVGSPGEPKPSVDRSRRLIRNALRSADVVTTSNPLLARDLRPPSGKVVRFQGPAPRAARTDGRRERALVWLGSPSTQSYLSLLRNLPATLRAQGWDCIAVGATDVVGVYGWRPVAWSPAAQTEWLSRALVGVMPQPSDPWSDRKQGYKLYEYMAQGVVPVASDVLPARIVLDDDELRSLLVADGGDWAAAIARAAASRDELTPRLERLLHRHSVETSLTLWLDAVGIGAAA